MVVAGNELLKPPTQNTQNTQKGGGHKAFESTEDIEYVFEKVKSYPIPTGENDFAQDERQAIQDVDGGVEPMPVDYPVPIVMNSAILGAMVEVMLWPDRATVDDVEYSQDELVDLKSRGLSAADLRATHEVKRNFDATVQRRKSWKRKPAQ